MSWENLELITVSCKTMLHFLRDWNCLWSAYGFFSYFCQHWVIIVVTLEPSPAVDYFWSCSDLIGIVEMSRYFSFHFCSGRWYPVSFQIHICHLYISDAEPAQIIVYVFELYCFLLDFNSCGVTNPSSDSMFCGWMGFFFFFFLVLCLSLPPDSHW